MRSFSLSACALCAAGAILLSQTASAQTAPPAAKGKAASPAKPAAAAKDAPKRGSEQKADAPKGKSGDAPRTARKPVTPDAKEGAKETRDDVKDRAKDTRDSAKDRAKDTRDEVKDRAKDTRDDAKDRTKDAREDAKDRAKDTRDDVKDRTRDTRDSARDRSKDTRDDSRNADKDRTQDKGDDAKDVAKDKGTAKDKGAAKDTAKNSGSKNAKGDSKQDKKFDADNVKPDDLGVTLKEADNGVAVSNISSGSLLADAGFQSGDRIVSINGQNLTQPNNFIPYLFGSTALSAGRVPVVVMRNGVRDTVYVRPNTIIRQYETVSVGNGNPVRNFGIVLDDRYRDRLFVDRVIADSPADVAGIRADDEITAVNDHEVATHSDLANALDKYGDQPIDMEVRRNRQAKVLEVKTLR